LGGERSEENSSKTAWLGLAEAGGTTEKEEYAKYRKVRETDWGGWSQKKSNMRKNWTAGKACYSQGELYRTSLCTEHLHAERTGKALKETGKKKKNLARPEWVGETGRPWRL